MARKSIGSLVHLPEIVVSNPTRSWGEAVARKPTDTVKLQLRLEEGLRRRLEREARWRRRSMNAEIVSRLQESFDIPDQAQDIASEVSSEVSYDIDEMGVAIQKSLDGIRDEIRTVLARLDAAQPKDDGEKK
jgi:hypothetical protein